MSLIWPIVEAVGVAAALIVLCWLGGIILDHIDEGTD